MRIYMVGDRYLSLVHDRKYRELCTVRGKILRAERPKAFDEVCEPIAAVYSN